MMRVKRSPSLVGLLVVGACALGACQERAIELDPDRSVRSIDLMEGSGLEAKEGRQVLVHYRGWVEDEERLIIDTYARNKPHAWVVGDDTVITGMDTGVRGMRVGGKRRLRVPAISGYGRNGHGEAVPPDATLIFEVELLDVRTGGSSLADMNTPAEFEGDRGRLR